MVHTARFALLPIAILLCLEVAFPLFFDVGARAAESSSDMLPSVYYAVWGAISVLFLGLAVVVVRQPKYVEDHIAAPLALAAAAALTWIFGVQFFDSVWLEVLVLIAGLLCAWEAAYRLDVIGGFDGTGRRLLTCAVIGLLAGWLAVMVSVTLAEIGRGLSGRGATDAVWISLWTALVPLAGMAWLFATRVSKNIWFFAALGAGMVGIVWNNWYTMGTHALAIATFVVGWIVIGRRLRYGASGALARMQKT